MTRALQILRTAHLASLMLLQWRGVVLGQGTGPQGEADIDISICLCCLFTSLSGRHSAGSHPPTLERDSSPLPLTISQWSCHFPHGQQIIWAGAVYEKLLDMLRVLELGHVKHVRAPRLISQQLLVIAAAEDGCFSRAEVINTDKFKCMQI